MNASKRKSVNFQILRSALIAAMLALSVECGTKSGLFVSGGNPPVFEIRRGFSDEVRVFPILIVQQLHPDNEQVSPAREEEAKNRVLWRIVAEPKYSDTNLVEKVERIEYGKVPAGFKQEIPSQGLPTELQENLIYEAQGPLSLMRNAASRFKIVDGKVVSLPIP
jgi:hypothetical protein